MVMTEPAGATVERLITTAGFDAVKAGGLSDAMRSGVSGDLHQYGGLNGNVVDADEARAALALAA
jgi:predicted dinucleotide-binding enzyme